MKTRILGLTGQSGAGKTTVSRHLAGLPGFFVIDADQVAREVVRRGAPCLQKLCEAFGEQILLPSGELDRRKLAGIVFSDPAQLAKLNAVTLPFITRRIEEQLESLRGRYRCVVLDAPTLFESGADRMCDAVAAVLADREKRIARIRRRDGLSEREAAQRVDAQHGELFYTRRAEYILCNNGGERELLAELENLMNRLQADHFLEK